MFSVVFLTGCNSGEPVLANNEVEKVAAPAASVAPAAVKPKRPAVSPLPEVTVYKSPTCGCCSKWVSHLQQAGFTVKTEDHKNMSPIKQKLGVPGSFAACHTATVGGYVVEGHVPANDMKRLLREQPEITGLTVPGMPLGSPGMEHPQPENYITIAFSTDGQPALFARHGPAVEAESE